MSRRTQTAATQGRGGRYAVLALLGVLLGGSSTALASKTSTTLTVTASVVNTCQIAAAPVEVSSGVVLQIDSASRSRFGLSCSQALPPLTQIGTRPPQIGAVDATELAAMAELAHEDGKPIVVTLYF